MHLLLSYIKCNVTLNAHDTSKTHIHIVHTHKRMQDLLTVNWCDDIVLLNEGSHSALSVGHLEH